MLSGNIISCKLCKKALQCQHDTANHAVNIHDSTPLTSCLKCGHKEISKTSPPNHASEEHCSNLPQLDGNIFFASLTLDISTLDTSSLHDHSDCSLPSIEDNITLSETLGDTSKTLPLKISPPMTLSSLSLPLTKEPLIAHHLALLPLPSLTLSHRKQLLQSLFLTSWWLTTGVSS